MTFIATHNVWVQADFTENNLGNINPGDPVEIVFDSLPGRIVQGADTQYRIRRCRGFGAAW